MVKLSWIFCILALVFAVTEIVSAKYVKGHIHTLSSWVFVTRFVFLKEGGKLYFNVKYPLTNNCCPSLVFYYDDHWTKVYPHPQMSCQSKLNFATKLYGTNLNYRLDSSSGATCAHYIQKETHYRRCSGELHFSTRRARWWFLVLSHCNQTDASKSSDLDVQFEFTITNGDSWDKHISGDEAHMVEITLVFLVLFTIAFTVGLVFARQLSIMNLLHRPYKVFIVSLGCEESALILETIYYIEYVVRGEPDLSLQTAGSLLHASGETLLLILLLLLAKGYTITRGRLSLFIQIKITIFAAIYSIAYTVLFILKTELFKLDPGVVRNDFDNYAGRTIVSLRLSSWVWFIVTSVWTVCCYPEKRRFYTWFCAWFSVWFLSKPSLILWSYIDDQPWQRLKIIKGIDLSICIIAYLIFLYLTRPTQANQNFPFHVRTNQIDVMTDKEADDFPHTEEFSVIGKQEGGMVETSFTDLKIVEDKTRAHGISSAWFSRKIKDKSTV